MENSDELLFKNGIYDFKFISNISISQIVGMALSFGLFVCLRCLFVYGGFLFTLFIFYKGAARNRSARRDATVLLKYRPYKTVQSPTTVRSI